MSPRSRLVLDQTGRRATGRAHWFETAIGCRFWLRVPLRGVPEFPVFSSESRADPPLLSMLEVAQIQPQPFWLFCLRQPRFTSSRPCIIARLPDYPVGMAWESSGVIKEVSSSIGKLKLSKRTVSRACRQRHRGECFPSVCSYHPNHVLSLYQVVLLESPYFQAKTKGSRDVLRGRRIERAGNSEWRVLESFSDRECCFDTALGATASSRAPRRSS
jgi:hypothetical protein